MKEVLYAADRQFLERYLKEKSAASIADYKAISDIWDRPIHLAGTPEAVNDIYTVDGNTAHIAITGPLSPDGPDIFDLYFDYGGTAYSTILGAIERAKTDPLVEKIILHIDSPGGTVAGVDEAWQAIRSAGKPVETRAGSVTASAAYWLASGTDKILASSPNSRIGSIGVLVATYDWSKFEENLGVKEVIITSGNAPDKHPDIKTESGRDTIKAQLDALERIFYARVSEGRGVSTEHIAGKFGKGGLLVAADPDLDKDDAVSVGMIDGLAGDAYISGKPFPGPRLTEEEKTETAPRSGVVISPATAGTGGNAMTLQEFMAQGPAAVAELDRVKAEAKAAGREEARAEYSARVEKILPVLTSESYPSHIKALAKDAFDGGEGMAAFKAGVSVYDAQTEKAKSDAAKAETAGTGAVGAEAPDMRAGGEKELDAALQAELDKRKVK